ncbi:MAG: hypothetical protein Q9162_003028 [Coniocarpon cinnabarinum]
MPSSCKDIRSELASCLQYSDCVFIERNKPGDCLRPPLRDTLPTQCQQLQKSYAECKKGWVDMRKRFRGNRPISMSQEIEADASGQSYQLYSGTPAFPRGVTGTAEGMSEEERIKAGEEARNPLDRGQ